MNDNTKSHPATSVFIAYINESKRVEAFENVHKYFTPVDQKIISKSIGWQQFVYSSSFKALKQGDCEQIKTTTLSKHRVQIDCLGKFVFQSYFIPESYENMHLRVFMRLVNDQWHISRSGYTHTQENGKGQAITRIGLKFQSVFE